MFTNPTKESFLPSPRPPLSKLLRLSHLRELGIIHNHEETWELCPQEYSETKAAIILPGQLDRVTRVQEETTLENELKRLEGGMRTHAATIARLYRNAHLISGHLYMPLKRVPLVHSPAPYFGYYPAEYIKNAAMASGIVGNRYFGHWLTDDCPTSLIKTNEGQRMVSMKPAASWTHVEPYRKLFNLNTHDVKDVRFDELVVFEDYGQNSYRRARYHQLRKTLSSSIKNSQSAGVFFIRGDSGAKRALLNEEEICNELQKLNFSIVNVTEDSVEEIISKSMGAPIAVGVEGSHLTHSIYTLASSGGVISLQAPDRFNNVLKDYTDCIGMSYGTVVGYGSSSRGFSISINDLLNTINELLTKH